MQRFPFKARGQGQRPRPTALHARRHHWMPVYIAGASQNRGQGKSALLPDSYIAYELRVKDGRVTSRRYTEFEGLQAHLYRNYPRSIIPPIPSKENLTGKSDELRQKVIQQRIRALQVFLDYIDGHPILAKDESYTKFISEDFNWMVSGEIQSSSPAPTNLSSTGSQTNSALTAKVYALQQTLEALERSQSKLLRGLKEAVKGYGDLGMALNGFSLENKAAEKELDGTGQVFDAISSQGHDIIENQTILTETIELCQQFCACIQRAIDNNGDLEAGSDAFSAFQEEVTRTVKLIEELLQSSIKTSMKSNSAFYSNCSEKFTSFKIGK